MSDATAVVLAAGKGTRMESDLPKVLVEVCGRPLIDYVLDALDAAGVARKIVVVGYEAHLVHEAVQVAGFGAEIAAAAAEATGCRVARLGAPRIPVGYAQVLENESRLSAAKVAQAAQKLLQRETR